MGIARVATVRHEGARPVELDAIHGSYSSVMLHGVLHSVVLFIMAVSLTWHDHCVGGNPGYDNGDRVSQD